MSLLHQSAQDELDTPLRQSAQDKLDNQYNKLYEICRKDCQAPLEKRLRQFETGAEQTRVEDIIGTKKDFRTKMTTDARYKNLAELLLRISPEIKLRL